MSAKDIQIKFQFKSSQNKWDKSFDKNCEIKLKRLLILYAISELGLSVLITKVLPEKNIPFRDISYGT